MTSFFSYQSFALDILTFIYLLILFCIHLSFSYPNPNLSPPSFSLLDLFLTDFLTFFPLCSSELLFIHCLTFLPSSLTLKSFSLLFPCPPLVHPHIPLSLSLTLILPTDCFTQLAISFSLSFSTIVLSDPHVSPYLSCLIHSLTFSSFIVTLASILISVFSFLTSNSPFYLHHPLSYSLSLQCGYQSSSITLCSKRPLSFMSTTCPRACIES